jgi:rhodanese-related sulfurtransferase
MLKTIPELVQEIRQHVRCVSAEIAYGEIKQNRGILIDVREAVEVAEKPVPESINIPRGVLEMKVSTLYPSEDHSLYIHCATGARATLAAEQLQRIGYRRVSVITCDLETICLS